MLNRKNLVVSFVVVLLLAMLAGCAAGGVTMPEEEVEISMDAAMAGQQKAMEGLMMGAATLSDSEISSLLTELIKQNMGDMGLLTGVTIQTEPGMMYISLDSPMGAVELVGNVEVVDNIVQVDLEQAAAMGMNVTGPLLDIVEGAINRALNSPELGVALMIEAGDGELMVGMDQ